MLGQFDHKSLLWLLIFQHYFQTVESVSHGQFEKQDYKSRIFVGGQCK